MLITFPNKKAAKTVQDLSCILSLKQIPFLKMYRAILFAVVAALACQAYVQVSRDFENENCMKLINLEIFSFCRRRLNQQRLNQHTGNTMEDTREDTMEDTQEDTRADTKEDIIQDIIQDTLSLLITIITTNILDTRSMDMDTVTNLINTNIIIKSFLPSWPLKKICTWR